MVLDKGDLRRDEINSGKIDDANQDRCTCREPQAGVEDSAVIVGWHEPDDGRVESKAREGHYQTGGGNERSSNANIGNRV